MPASVGGVNALNSLMQMPGEDAIYTFNLMPVEYGMRTRLGYRQWATGCDGDVRTILSYEGNIEGDDKLWAVTENGLYDVTLFNTTTPVLETGAPFAVQGLESGYGVHCQFVNDAGARRLFYADAANGVFEYQDTTGWARPTGWTYNDGSGPAVAVPYEKVVFIMVHKLRLWFVIDGGSNAWYLPLYSISGVAEMFVFGAKMPHGGELVGLWSWTLDGGSGVDDYMIAVSRSGDVLVYKGDDPAIVASETANNPWSLVGSWYIGEIPDSRRIALSQGSELYLLSIFGITSLRDLMQGSTAEQTTASVSAKVNRFLRADVQKGLALHEWALTVNPGDGFIQVVTPEPTNTPYVQYCQNITTKAWGFWENVPILCADTWDGEFYMGGKDGVVWWYNGGMDGVTLDGYAGVPVDFRVLTSFQGLDSHAAYKNVGFIRPIGILAGTANVNVTSVFDYNITIPIAAPPVSTAGGDPSLWNSALWDDGVWDYTLTGASIPIGALGHRPSCRYRDEGKLPKSGHSDRLGHHIYHGWLSVRV